MMNDTYIYKIYQEEDVSTLFLRGGCLNFISINIYHNTVK